MTTTIIEVRKREGGQSGDGAQEPRHDDEAAAGAERQVLCTSCRHPLARAGDRIERSGRHRHTCVNPHGFVYRIELFRCAEGSVGVGEWSDEHSWFTGTFWQVACCRSCSIHVGWSFSGEDDEFCGLIADRIEES